MILSFIGQPVFLLDPQLLNTAATSISERTATITFFIFIGFELQDKDNI